MHKGLDVRENLSCWEMAVSMAVTEPGRLEVTKWVQSYIFWDKPRWTGLILRGTER